MYGYCAGAISAPDLVSVAGKERKGGWPLLLDF